MKLTLGIELIFEFFNTLENLEKFIIIILKNILLNLINFNIYIIMNEF